jgi:hypothetical protein
MRDLDLARQIFRERNLSLVMVKEGGLLFESASSGINGLLQAIDALNGSLHGSSVADKVVGRAAALLLVYAHAKEVYAATVSNEGLKALEENGVPVEYDALVQQILDRTGKNICPFEKASQTIRAPEEAPEKLRACVENVRKRI